MTGADAPAAPPRRRGCVGRCALLALVLLAVVVAWGARTWQRLRADAPLPFEPFRWQQLERSLLEAKFELRDLSGRMLGGATEVSLSERELNAVVFGSAEQTPERKARLLIRDGRLRLESSTPRARGEGYWNVAVDVALLVGPQGLVDVQVLGGQVGDYGLDPVSQALLVRAIRAGAAEAFARDERLRRVRALTVDGDHVRLTYDRPERR